LLRYLIKLSLREVDYGGRPALRPSGRAASRRVQVRCADNKNPAMCDDTPVLAICITKTAYFCGSQGASQPLLVHAVARLSPAAWGSPARAASGIRGEWLSKKEPVHHPPPWPKSPSLREIHHRSGIVPARSGGTRFAASLTDPGWDRGQKPFSTSILGDTNQ
jgi:hypothetical protein